SSRPAPARPPCEVRRGPRPRGFLAATPRTCAGGRRAPAVIRTSLRVTRGTRVNASLERRREAHRGVDLDLAGRDRRGRLRRAGRHAAREDHRPRTLGHALLLEAHDPGDGGARARRGGVRASARVLDRLLERLALELVALLHVEADAGDLTRARADGLREQ